MAKSERNPIKIMLLVNTILIVGIIAIMIFWNQKTDGEKVGYFLPKADEDNSPAPTTTVVTTTA